VRSVTIVAIFAAAAAGIISGTVLLVYPFVSGVEPATDQRDLVMDDGTPTKSGYRQVNIIVNGIEIIADIASTDDHRSKGLAVKNTLSENEGMLFVFNAEHEHSFWMKDMKFPIDIIWLDSHKEVVHVEHSLEPCASDSPCHSYQPNDNSLYVLETVAGFAEKYNVTNGTQVEFSLDA
jgi:uncharacterized protein